MTDRGGNLADLVAAAATRHGDRPALIGDGPDRSWSELDAAADAGAAALQEAGAVPGERVLIVLPTSADLAAARIAVARAGLVAVPIEPGRPGRERVAARVGARVAIGPEPVPGVPLTVVPADIAGWWSGRGGRVDPLAGGEDLAELARASRSDRAVMIPHRAVLAAVAAVVAAQGLGLRADDRAVLALPLSHLAGFVTGFLPLAAIGGAAVLPTGGTPIGEVIRRHRATVLPGSPAVYRELLADPSAERDLATVRLMTSGAAPLTPADFAAVRALTGQSVWEGYGISESTSTVATSLMTPRARSGSVGLPLPGIAVRIVPDGTDDLDGWLADAPADDDSPPAAEPDLAAVVDLDDSDDDATDAGAVEPGQETTPEPAAPSRPVETLADIGDSGEVGRIAVKGDTLFLGYWPDGADGPREDGWFITSDIAYTDDNGELHLVDRASDTFQVAGFTVYPGEIERVLTEHPYVTEAVVVGLPTPRGTTVVAVLSARPGTNPTAEDLADFVAARLPVFKRPNEFAVESEMPRTELGRLDRPAVLARLAAERGIDLAVPAPWLSAVEHPKQPASEDAAAEAEGADPSAAVDVTPEVAADLDRLGRGLPGTTARGGRVDPDDDLFGDEFS